MDEHEMKVLMSSKSNEWETPDSLFSNLNARYGFTLDPAATEENAKCKKYFTSETNGLTKSWKNEVVFLNPPYGREVGTWVKKAYDESRKDTKSKVVLIPARTDTKYFSKYCSLASNIFFIQGRLKFNNRTLPSYKEDGSHKLFPATFPSVIVVFNSLREGTRNVQWCNRDFTEFW